MIAGLKGKKSVGIFIGPEGGFDEAEVEAAMAAGVLPVTLGKRILRTETAGLAMLSVLMFEFEEEEYGDQFGPQCRYKRNISG